MCIDPAFFLCFDGCEGAEVKLTEQETAVGSQYRKLQISWSNEKVWEDGIRCVCVLVHVCVSVYRTLVWGRGVV